MPVVLQRVPAVKNLGVDLAHLTVYSDPVVYLISSRWSRVLATPSHTGSTVDRDDSHSCWSPHAFSQGNAGLLGLGVSHLGRAGGHFHLSANNVHASVAAPINKHVWRIRKYKQTADMF